MVIRDILNCISDGKDSSVRNNETTEHQKSHKVLEGECVQTESPKLMQQQPHRAPPDVDLGGAPCRSDFDFNDFFNIDNIPGLNVSSLTGKQ